MPNVMGACRIQVVGPVFPVSRVQHMSELHSKFALRRPMCGSMVDIQFEAAEIRRGKKRR